MISICSVKMPFFSSPMLTYKVLLWVHSTEHTMMAEYGFFD